MDPRTLPAAFKQKAKWHPDELAFLQADGGPERQYTYKEAYEQACKFANALRAAGIKPGERVAFLSETTVEHAIAYFGCQLVGAIPVTVHVREAPQTIKAMLNRVTPKITVYQRRFAYLIIAIRDDVSSLSEFVYFDTVSAPQLSESATPYSAFIADFPADQPDITITEDDIAFINFSSGTTATPKGIVHTQAEAIEGAHLGQYKLNIYGDGAYLIQATPSFIGWSMLLFPTINTGATGVFLEEWSPEMVLKSTEDYSLDLLLLVSTQWQRVLDADVDAYDMSSITHAIYTGEPINTALLEAIRKQICEKVYTVYSSTEALNAGTVLFPNRVSPDTVESVGRPTPNTNLRIIKPDSTDPEAQVPQGEVGEIIIRGPPVANRVWGSGSENADLFHEDGWWFSGDLGYVDSRGNLVLKGRVNNMIKSGGINVYAEGVEKELEHHEKISEALVVGVNDEKWGEAVKAYVVRTDPDITSEDIDNWCRTNDRLANYQRPRRYEFVESLPRTSSQKLDRDSLS